MGVGAELTDDVEIADLELHRGRVDLTHVGSLVFDLYVRYDEIPRTMTVVCNFEAIAVSYDGFGKGQQSILLHVEPGNLEEKNIG